MHPAKRHFFGTDGKVARCLAASTRLFSEPQTLAEIAIESVEVSHTVEGTMMRIHVLLASLVALTSPAVAASTPGELVQELSRTAHDSDQKGFLAAMSASTRRAMAEAEAMGSKLTLAQKDFSTALDESFGIGLLGGAARFPIADRKAVLARFVAIDLVGVEQKTPKEARLRLKTITKNFGDQTATEEDTFTAVKENGEWKLDLSDLTHGIMRTAVQRAAAYKHVAEEVRSGAFKDRISALIALAKAQRGLRTGGAEK